ncbi:putative ATPase YjoB [Pseudocercospora fuligena]|uniref:Putative ATPase YjoB n=1 Tax=Pseudocercospora fuligena TaxID=685502 RepID=A0A8H6RDB6_9PEZI|nr:putative ATPase YjoB [Pseudocercospora fuligena]
MTAGKLEHRPGGPRNETSHRYFAHSSAERVNTDAIIVESLRAQYPELRLTVVPLQSCNILGYAAAGKVAVAPIDNEKDRLSWRLYHPPASRLDGKGGLGDSVKFGKYLIDWKNKEFVMYVVEGRDGAGNYPQQVNQYILSPSIEAVNQLLIEAGAWDHTLHEEIWVFDGGYWQKSQELFESVRKASWDDVILDDKRKKTIREDVSSFYDSRQQYERLKVPWKRGMIFYGPPGNGKTISLKAMMNQFYSRDDPIPTLYVKSLASFAGPEYSINQIFGLARRTAPCLLIFEDLDSIVTDAVRSYFLNAVDGIAKNDGILMIGSTNHLDRLDPGLAKRPSRFDRKYLFDNPNEKERGMYMQYWQKKLADNKDLDFPDKLCPAVAKITKDFSFAYLQEAMVAALLAIARDQDSFSERTCLECLEAHERPSTGSSCDRESARPFRGLYDFVWDTRRIDEEDPDLDNYILWREIKKQVRILREELGDEKGSKR